MMQDFPPPIRTDASNVFANHTMAIRVPATIREIQALNPDYPTSIQRALDDLHDAIANDAPITMLDAPAPDYAPWAQAVTVRLSESWQNTEWFFAETYFYRRVIEAVRWWDTGRDPFAPKKAQEYAGGALWSLLGDVLNTQSHHAIGALIQTALWGNRIDLSFTASLSRGVAANAEDLLVDDSAAVIAHLEAAQAHEVHFVCDNAGTELAMDLALADALLRTPTKRVVLHLKMHPTFVSDATVADVLWFIQRLMQDQNQSFAEFGKRLQAALDAGRLRLIPDFFWNSPHFMRHMPSYLAGALRQAALVIVKGDANYRRLVGDAFWDATTPFAQVVRLFPAPILALRTLKSDPIVGLQVSQTARLDATGELWRSNGRYGVIQFTVPG